MPGHGPDGRAAEEEPWPGLTTSSLSFPGRLYLPASSLFLPQLSALPTAFSSGPLSVLLPASLSEGGDLPTDVINYLYSESVCDYSKPKAKPNLH